MHRSEPTRTHTRCGVVARTTFRVLSLDHATPHLICLSYFLVASVTKSIVFVLVTIVDVAMLGHTLAAGTLARGRLRTFM